MSVTRIDRIAVGPGSITPRLHHDQRSPKPDEATPIALVISALVLMGANRIDACGKEKTRSGMASTLIAANPETVANDNFAPMAIAA